MNAEEAFTEDKVRSSLKQALWLLRILSGPEVYKSNIYTESFQGFNIMEEVRNQNQYNNCHSF